MKLSKARIQNYRSIIDTGEFEIEDLKTIMVGPNEAGKTVVLRALQQLNKPDEVDGFDILRDYPRSKYNDISSGRVLAEDTIVVTGWFKLDEADKADIPTEFHNCVYKIERSIDNQSYHSIENGPSPTCFSDIRNDLSRLVSHLDKQYFVEDPIEEMKKPSNILNVITKEWEDSTEISGAKSSALVQFLDNYYALIQEDNTKEEKRHENLRAKAKIGEMSDIVLNLLDQKMPVFILFNNYSKVKPLINLEHLYKRSEGGLLDDKYYDYGNLCLLKLLGFNVKELSDFGNIPVPRANDPKALKEYQDKLDNRSYLLNAASIHLTKEIRKVWMPNPNRPEADKLRVTADGQYLKVVVEDDMGVDIELDQRSEGFQWLVSFFIIFFAEAADKHKNAILLLDEPGMSLHALKQRDFRATISRLAEQNQTIYTTHSPFLVGPDELNIVKVVEMKDRSDGTKIHNTINSSDPAALLPLQEALGYDLAQSLFTQKKNLILEGLTDYWYIEATSALLRVNKIVDLNDKISLVFANTAGKVVYYATILHAQNLKIAALLDSDSAGDQAATQDSLVYTLGNKNILRTKDYCQNVTSPEIEDLLRDTLIKIVETEYSIDCKPIADSQPKRNIVSIFQSQVSGFSKYDLAKHFIKWTRSNDASNLTEVEISNWTMLIENINKVLK
ncbi:AAA family ATPase [Psychrobacter fjordensis]|uniref:AAA family ATPase n=1 Tax=Psychrobacter fjordensis TaxID=664424 RepID=UPI001919D7F7|nr:AAA family ATPase [Psychrobacter fjordensis]